MAEESPVDFREEKLRLEREALEIERERLGELRAKYESALSEVGIRRKASLRWLVPVVVALFGALCFLIGERTGVTIEGQRAKRERDEHFANRLQEALSQIDKPAQTNDVDSATGKKVSVLVIQ